MSDNLKPYMYKPTAPQLRFHNSKAKYRAFLSGIRGGKTYAGSWELLRHVITYPKSTALVVSPTYGMMKTSTLSTFLEICPMDLIAKRKDGTLAYDKEAHNIKMYNGSEIRFRSADDPNKIRGMEVSFFWLDEGGQLPSDEMWQIGIGRMSQRCAPQKAICTTTPNGMNWLWQFFMNPRTAQMKKEVALFFASTMDNSENLPDGYIESLESQYSGQFFKQELMGEFVGYEGLVYPDFSTEIHVTENIIDPNYDQTIVRVDAGVDWGYRDPTVAVVVGTDKFGRKYIYDELYVTDVDLEVVRPDMARMFSKYNVRNVYCDPSRPDGIVFLNKVANRKWEATKAKNEIVTGISAVSQYFKLNTDGKPRMYIHPRCKNLINELQLYRYSTKSKNGVSNEYPLGKHDHCMDGIRYAIATPILEEHRASSDRFKSCYVGTRGW